MLFNILKNTVVYGGLSFMSLTAGVSTAAINNHKSHQIGDGIDFFILVPISFVSSISAVTICASTMNPYSIGVSVFFYTVGYYDI